VGFGISRQRIASPWNGETRNFLISQRDNAGLETRVCALNTLAPSDICHCRMDNNVLQPDRQLSLLTLRDSTYRAPRVVLSARTFVYTYMRMQRTHARSRPPTFSHRGGRATT